MIGPRKKAQTSVEFSFLLGFMFILFLIFFKIVQDRVVTADYNYDRQSMKELKNIIVNELRNAEGFEIGYTREFNLPTRLNGKNYSAEIWDYNEIIIKIPNQEYVDFLDQEIYGIYIPDPITGVQVLSLLNGKNMICKKRQGPSDNIFFNLCA